MSKKRKTLKQKKESDLRKVSSLPDNTRASEPQTYSFSLADSPTTPVANTTPKQISVQNISHYLHQDLRKSVIASVGLIAINIVIYILIENNVIPLRVLGL